MSSGVRSPRRAITFLMPAAFMSSMRWWMVSLVLEMQVRCASIGMLKLYLRFFAISSVYWLTPPPAPYVTLMNAGLSFAIASVAALTFSKLVSFFGGNTSKERLILSCFRMSIIFIVSPCNGRLCAIVLRGNA